VRLKRSLGLCVAKCDAEEALATDWSSVAQDIDFVRVPDPPTESWTALRAAGFVCKPKLIRWYTGTADDETGFRARMSRRDRQNLRRAERIAHGAGLTIDVVRPIGRELMEEFLVVYEARVAERRRGLNVAGDQRDEIIGDEASLAVVVRDRAGHLVGMTIGHESPDGQAVRLSVSAVTPQWRRASLSRVMYARAADVARDLGRPRLTAGTDPNLYGVIAEPGLYSFKVRLGFTPTAPQVHAPEDRMDEADLVLSLERLSDPSLILGYRHGDERSDLDLHVLGADRALDLRPYRPGLPGPPIFHHIAPAG
jgi:GNAT superfamily N-acetyltransferase